MIELNNRDLVFSFPEVHRFAELRIMFERTLRIPDDGKVYELPPGMGAFPLFQVDDFAEKVPSSWIEHGGAMLPMYQSEAMWIYPRASYHEEDEHPVSTDENVLIAYERDSYYTVLQYHEYPFAIKIAAGKINALTGKRWTDSLQSHPQDYIVSVVQPWLDGYCVKKGVIRQFVAMPLGSGYTAEAQLTKKEQYGGLQLVVYPMKRKSYERLFPPERITLEHGTDYWRLGPSSNFEMGLAPGGTMKQKIYQDPFDIDDWDMDNKSRCYIHIVNSLMWRAITGGRTPTVPFTAKEYTEQGLPWFDYYDEKAKALPGSSKLKALKSVVKMGKKKGDVPLPENESVSPKHIIKLRRGLREHQVREGIF